jgi:HAE1 family hydrophobic/amphiphilic exporter-1
VEYAIQRHAAGKVSIEAAMEGAKAFPSYFDDFVCVHWFDSVGFASGPGKSNRTIGTAAAEGMLIGTLCGVFIIPGLYYILVE